MKQRPYIYLYQPAEECVFYSSGVEFREFIAASGSTNLLLVKHEYGRKDPDPHTGFLVIEPQEIADLCADNPYGYGDFHLLDVPNLKVLHGLRPQEIAEILYLSHKYEPLASPFLPGLGNTFAYLAHDDGWFTKTFFRDTERYYHLQGEILRQRVGRLRRRRLPPLPSHITSLWAEWARQGLYIDLCDTTQTPEEFTLRFYLVGPERAPFSPGGPPTGIDAITNNKDHYKGTSKRGLLRCLKRQWSAEAFT